MFVSLQNMNIKQTFKGDSIVIPGTDWHSTFQRLHWAPGRCWKPNSTWKVWMVGESCIVRTFMWLETWLRTSYVSLYYDLGIFSFVLGIKRISSSKISIQSNVRRKLKNPAASTNDTRQHSVGIGDFVSGQVDFNNIDDVIYSGRISLFNIDSYRFFVSKMCVHCTLVCWPVLDDHFFCKWVFQPSASVLKSWNPRLRRGVPYNC